MQTFLQRVRHSYGLTDDLLRLSIGIEDARDLIETCVRPWKDKTMGKYDFRPCPIVLDIHTYKWKEARD